MQLDDTRFSSEKDLAQFVRAKALEVKKPYRVSRSDSKRFHICCQDDRCPFKMRFCARKDGVFRLILNVAHTCTMFNLTTPAAFIKDLSETTSRKTRRSGRGNCAGRSPRRQVLTSR